MLSKVVYKPDRIKYFEWAKLSSLNYLQFCFNAFSQVYTWAIYWKTNA